MQNPRQYKIPDWFLNRQKDIRDGKYSQLLSNNVDIKLRDDLELMKKIRCHRGIRHYWGCVMLSFILFKPFNSLISRRNHLDCCGFPSFLNSLWVCPCSVRVRGQHTKTTGRRGRTVGVAKKKGA